MNLDRAGNVTLQLKIGLPGDDLLKEKVDFTGDTSKYIIPMYHQRGKAVKQPAQIQRPLAQPSPSPVARNVSNSPVALPAP